MPLLRAFYGPLRDRVDEKRTRAQAQRLHDRGDRRGLLLGHPMVIRLGRNGRFLACSLYPEHKETRPLPGDEPPPQEGTGEVCPKCGEGTLVGKRGRFGPFVGCSRYPDCDYIKKDGPPPPDPLPFEVDLPEEQRRPPRPASRAAHRERLLGLLELPEVRLTRRTTSRSAASTTPTTARWRARARRRICLNCGSTSDAPRRSIVPGERYPGGPPNPEALARPARARRGRGGRRGRRPAAADVAARAAGREHARRRTRPGRAGRRRVSAVAGRPCDPSGARAVPPVPRRARRLAAHAACLRDGRRRLPRLARPPAASTGARPARADLRAYLGRPRRGPRPLDRSPSGWPRSARSTAGRRATAWPPGDPWGAIATPRLPRRLPRVLEVDQVERLLAVVDDELTAADAAEPGPHRAWPIALALRDRALVETAYAAGLRISELAAADLGVARPAARRAPGARQGPQGADRAARAARPRGARRRTSRTAGRSCSSAAPTRRDRRRPRSS